MKQISEAFLSSDDKSNFLIDGVEVNNVGLLQFDFSGSCLLQFWFFEFGKKVFRLHWSGWYSTKLKGLLMLLLCWMMGLGVLTVTDGKISSIGHNCDSSWCLFSFIADSTIILHISAIRVNEAVDTKEMEGILYVPNML